MGTIWTERHSLLRAKLREMRTSYKLTQATLAQRLQKPQSYVSKYESGERNLDLIEIHDICLACGVRLVDFIAQYETAMDNMPRQAE